MDSLEKMSQNIFAYSFVSGHSKHLKKNKKIKKLASLAVERATPPPFTLAEAFAKNASFFYVLP